MYSHNSTPSVSEAVHLSSKSSTDGTTISALHPTTEPALPEGGTAAWCALLGAFLASFCGFGYANSFGVYQAFYSQQYLTNESSSAISWIGGLVSFLGPCMGTMCGHLFDKGYFYHMWITGAILESFSIFMLSLVKPGNYYQILLAQGFGFGIGLGLIYVPSFAILSHYFKRRRPAMMSIVASGAALGGVVHPIMINKLLNSSVGFEAGVRISAAFLAGLLFLCCILVHPRYHAVPQRKTEVDFWTVTKKYLTELPSLFTIIGITFFQIGYMYPLFYIQTDSLKHGLSASFSFYTIVIISAGSFCSRCMAGAILPYLRIVDLSICATFCCGVLIIGMIWIDSVASFVVFGLLFGVFSGLTVGMITPMLGLMSDPAELGARIGVGVTISGIGNLVGPPICGALLTRQYIWWRPALFSGGILLLSSACLLAVRFLLARAAVSDRQYENGERPHAAEIGPTETKSEGDTLHIEKVTIAYESV